MSRPVPVSISEPGPVNRHGAASAAHRVLQGPQYRAAEPSLLQRVVTRASRDLSHALGRASDAVGGPVVLVLLVLLVIGVVVVIRVRLGRLPIGELLSGRRAATSRRSAADYRQEAAELARGGHFAEAVRATTRAMVRELEERGVLEPTPGTTAAELSATAARAVPAVGGDAAIVAGVFYEVWYSGRPASAADATATAAAEARISSGRLRIRDTVSAGAARMQP